jgi:hypothetical protein
MDAGVAADGATVGAAAVDGATAGAVVTVGAVDAVDAEADGEELGPPDPHPAMTTAMAKPATRRRGSIPGTSEADRIEAHWRSPPA